MPFNPEINLPDWLRIATIDDLKMKLVGITITASGVFFLGAALAGEGDSEIIDLGVAIATVVVALTYFLSTLHEQGSRPD